MFEVLNCIIKSDKNYWVHICARSLSLVIVIYLYTYTIETKLIFNFKELSIESFQNEIYFIKLIQLIIP